MARASNTEVVQRGSSPTPPPNGAGRAPGNGAGRPGVNGPGRTMGGARGVMAREPDRIGRFLQDVVVGIQPGGSPARLVLRHVESGSKVGALIGQMACIGLDPDDIQTLALQIYDKAENDAAGLGRGTQRYVLQAFLEEDPGEEPVRVVFSVNSSESSPGKGGDRYIDSDPPNESGLMQMLMRERSHRDDQMSEIVETVLMMVTAMRQINTDMADEVRGMRAEIRQNFDAVQKANTELWKREREDKELEAKVSVQRELASGIRLMLPAVARRIGAIDPKQPIPADEAALAAVVGSFTQEQLEKFMASDIFSDAQKISLLECVTENVKKQEAGAPVMPPTQPAVQG